MLGSFRFSRLAFLLFVLLVLLLPEAYGRSVRSSNRTKARDQVTDTPRRRSRVVRKRGARTARLGGSSARATSRTRKTRRKRVRVRNYWIEGSYGDSTAGDSLEGEDMVVREAALSALGPLNGSVVVADPNSGRVLSMLGQKLVLSGGEQPCSTIKLPVALAALNEGLINRDTEIPLNRRWSLNLTEAIAHSNNKFFEVLGRRMGFEKLSQYASLYGLGERAGWNIPGEQPGYFPEEPAREGGVAKMSSFGKEIFVTPLQLAALVSAIANGGTLYYLQYPRTPEEVQGFQPKVKRYLEIDALLPDLREGMLAAVDHGTAKRAAQPYDAVLGKTGTCSRDGAHLGWFASYEGKTDPKLAVVVLLRGGRLSAGAEAAEVGGRVYRTLHERNYFASLPAAQAARADAARSDQTRKTLRLKPRIHTDETWMCLSVIIRVHPWLLSDMRRKAKQPAGRARETRFPAGAYSDDGVDLTLIRWMLSLTPAERLRVLQSSVRSIQRIRSANARD